MGINNTNLSIRDLSFNYGEKSILKSINYDFKPNKLTFILGRNGSGKSTLLRIMAGLVKPNNGQVLINSKNISDFSLKERASVLGFMSQHHTAIFPFTVLDVVLTGMVSTIKIAPSKQDYDLAAKAIERAGIAHLTERIYTELSGGEQQLVMIARVLAQQPKILLLDEPTSSLDFCNQIHVLTLLKKLSAEGITVICVLHDPNAAFQFGDEFVFLKDGAVFYPDNDSNIKSPNFLSSVFMMPLDIISIKDRTIIYSKDLPE